MKIYNLESFQKSLEIILVKHYKIKSKHTRIHIISFLDNFLTVLYSDYGLAKSERGND